MADFTHELQGTTPTTIGATDKLQFAASGGFDTRITVNEWNDTTHVKSSGGADSSDGNTPRNNKFVSQTDGTAGASEVSIDGATAIDLPNATTSQAALKINFADAASVETSDALFYGFNGTTPATAMAGTAIKAAEVGDDNFTDANGSGDALALADNDTPGTSHDFFIVISASPTSVGLKEGKYRIELTFF